MEQLCVATMRDDVVADWPAWRVGRAYADQAAFLARETVPLERGPAQTLPGSGVIEALVCGIAHKVRLPIDVRIARCYILAMALM